MIIWIASYPKSGNTWLRLLLDSWIGDYPPRPDQRMRFSGDHRDDYLWQRVMPMPMNRNAPTYGLYTAQLWPAFYMHCLHARPKVTFWPGQQPRLLMKTHHAFIDQTSVPSIPPGLTDRAIYITRDPRDVALSLANHFTKPIDVAMDFMNSTTARLFGGNEGTEPVPEFVGSWSFNVRTWLDPDDDRTFPVLHIRYEDMLCDTKGTFRKVLEFIGAWPKGTDAPETRERLDRVVLATKFDRMQALERSVGCHWRGAESGPFFHHGRSRWRTELTTADEAHIVDDHREMMERMGYL